MGACPWIVCKETRESCKIVQQLIEQILLDPVMTKIPRIIKVPEGEAPSEPLFLLGEMGYYVVDSASGRSASRSARRASTTSAITPWVLKGVYVPDIITILASLYFILGDIDR